VDCGRIDARYQYVINPWMAVIVPIRSRSPGLWALSQRCRGYKRSRRFCKSARRQWAVGRSYLLFLRALGTRPKWHAICELHWCGMRRPWWSVQQALWDVQL